MAEILPLDLTKDDFLEYLPIFPEERVITLPSVPHVSCFLLCPAAHQHVHICISKVCHNSHQYILVKICESQGIFLTYSLCYSINSNSTRSESLQDTRTTGE